ncbi:MAG: acyl-CoA synthetase [Pseudomonadota bacterium]
MSTRDSLSLARRSNRVMNFGTFMTQAAARLPDHPALIRGDEVRTYGEVNAHADALAHALTDMGVRKGDAVLMHSPNALDMAEVMYGVFKTGAVLVPTNFRLSADDIARMGTASGATAFIGHARFPEHIDAVRQAGYAHRRETIIGDTYDATIDGYLDKGPFPAAAVDYDDPCWYFFTSGTTGFPKCAVLTHGQMAFVINNHQADLMPGLSYGDASLVIAPLSHGAGLHYFIQVAKGATNILMPGDGLDPADAFALIEKHRVTNMFTVPTIIKRLVEHEAVDQFDHTSLKHVIYAGAPMYRHDQKRALEKLGGRLVQYFGMGEVTGAITWLPADEHFAADDRMRLGTCGFARTGMEVAILDDDAKQLAPRETGDIAVRGPAVCSGYLNNEEANAKAFRDGWFVTGDVGHMDEDGYLYITGRRSDMYISGGSNIYPREIEEKLLEHPAILEVAIVGVPDADWGEVGAAAIVLSAEADENEQGLRDWIDVHVAKYKRPKHVILWDEMPKSGYGKIEKKTVRQLLADGELKAVFDGHS